MSTAREDFETALGRISQALSLAGTLAGHRNVSAAEKTFKAASVSLGSVTAAIGTYVEEREDNSEVRAAAQAISTGLAVGGIALIVPAVVPAVAGLAGAVVVSFAASYVVTPAVRALIDRAFDVAPGALQSFFGFYDTDIDLRDFDGGQVVYATDGADRLIGTEFPESLFGLGKADRLEGGGGDDELVAGAGNDRLFGGDGDDTLIGEAGADVVRAGDGDDWIVASDEQDNIRGGAHFDTLVILFEDGNLGRMNVRQVEHIVLGENETHGGFVFNFTANNWSNTVEGNDAANSILGRAGHDALFGRDAADTLSGGKGRDSLYGETGNDSLEGGRNNDILMGNEDDDTLFGNNGGDTLWGGTGHDVLDGGSGHDSLDGGSGRDALRGGSGRDTLDGGPDNDVITLDHGKPDLAQGGDGDDVFIWTAGRAHTIDGGDGHDILDLRVARLDRVDFSNIIGIEEVRIYDLFVGEEDLSNLDLAFTLMESASLDLAETGSHTAFIAGKLPVALAEDVSVTVAVTQQAAFSGFTDRERGSENWSETIYESSDPYGFAAQGRYLVQGNLDAVDPDYVVRGAHASVYITSWGNPTGALSVTLVRSASVVFEERLDAIYLNHVVQGSHRLMHDAYPPSLGPYENIFGFDGYPDPANNVIHSIELQHGIDFEDKVFNLGSDFMSGDVLFA